MCIVNTKMPNESIINKEIAKGNFLRKEERDVIWNDAIETCAKYLESEIGDGLTANNYAQILRTDLKRS